MKIFELDDFKIGDFCELLDENENKVFAKITKGQTIFCTDREEDNWVFSLNKNYHEKVLKKLGKGEFEVEVDKKRKSICFNRADNKTSLLCKREFFEGNNAWLNVYKETDPYLIHGSKTALRILAKVKDNKIERYYLPLWSEEEPNRKFYIRLEIFLYLSRSGCPVWVNYHTPLSYIVFMFETDEGLKLSAVVEPNLSFHWVNF